MEGGVRLAILCPFLAACAGRVPFEAMPPPPGACPTRDEAVGFGLEDVVDDYEAVLAAGLADLSDPARFTLLVDVLPAAIVRLEEAASRGPGAEWALACAYAAYADLGAELTPPAGASRAEIRSWRMDAARSVYPRFRGIRMLAVRHGRIAVAGADAAWRGRVEALVEALGGEGAE